MSPRVGASAAPVVSLRMALEAIAGGSGSSPGRDSTYRMEESYHDLRALTDSISLYMTALV